VPQDEEPKEQTKGKAMQPAKHPVCASKAG